VDSSDGGALVEKHPRHLELVEGAGERGRRAWRRVEPARRGGLHAIVVEIDGAEETASGAEDDTDEDAEETGGGAEAEDSELDITDTSLIGLQILPGISRNTYG
jgi:hypothetical protein